MNEQPPSVGRIVHVHVPGFYRDQPVAAIVTLVATEGPHGTIHATLFPPGFPPTTLSPIVHADKAVDKQPRWSWPPRV